MRPRSGSDARPAGPKLITKGSILALAAGLAVGTVVTAAAVKAVPDSTAPSCGVEQRPLRVAAAAEIAPVIKAVVDAENLATDDCRLRVEVTSSIPSATAAALQKELIDRPDVWIPDSSVWTERSMKPGTGVPDNNPSVARSPLTVAVPASVAAGLRRGAAPLTTADLIPATPEVSGPVRWVLPEPDGAASTIGALIGLQAAVGTRPERSALLTTVLRSSSRTTSSLAALAEKPAKTALPTTEQQLFSHNLDRRNSKLVAVYPAGNGFSFDYPFVILAAERARRSQATELLASLQGDLGRRLLDTAGFRSVDGSAGPSLQAQAPGDARRPAGVVPDATAVNAAFRAFAAVNAPTRLLAVIDVSGSMKRKVPGAGGATRLDLAVNAAVNGLAVYPDDTAVGLWTFATQLTPTTDYRSLAPIAPLGRGADGVSGRERMAKALAAVTISKQGKSGLYDTTLAAVREVRRGWDPKRVNSVVVITDGGNNDPTGITLQRLVATLRHEHDPARPVALFSIAYGPTGDLPSLTMISQATGGKAYAAPDPRMISRVLGDAIGRRACAPNC
ncbi:MAG TPA: substrate-binding domain-containing protein [Propionibacteriaceae bacterium]|nr:substrate-binding domain-containing protein [Propionibacteriaceae bacterium]